ncbi:MAG TPA: alpha/beta hydrolase [Planctomycetota bacterium]|nr:alpha/beta hydrolase [Planctomycetota bacterium]
MSRAIKSMLKIILLLALSSAILYGADAPQEILLWPNGAPGSEGKNAPEIVKTSANGERQVSSIHKPSITPFLPAKEKATGVGVLVIPGGGHRMLCVDHEGVFVAQWFADHGVAAFVLKHRLAREEGSTYTIMDHAVPDAQRAMRLIRSRAAEWGIDPARLGAIGFSAGGELVAQACMKPGEGKADAADPIDKLNSKPAFQGLIYPGRSGDIQPLEKDTAPAFFACSAYDRQDISEGLAEAYLRFKRAKATAELHIYSTGGHGFGLRPGMKGALAGWPDRFMEFLESKGFLHPKT